MSFYRTTLKNEFVFIENELLELFEISLARGDRFHWFVPERALGVARVL